MLVDKNTQENGTTTAQEPGSIHGAIKGPCVCACVTLENKSASFSAAERHDRYDWCAAKGKEGGSKSMAVVKNNASNMKNKKTTRKMLMFKHHVVI